MNEQETVSVERVKDQLPEDEVLYDLAELFKIFGDSTRVKLLYILSVSEMCVQDLVPAAGGDPVGGEPSSFGR